MRQVVAQIPCQTDQMLLDKSDSKSAGGMILCYIEHQNEKRKAFPMCINPDPTGYLNLAENALLSGAASGITSIPAASARNTRAKRFQIIRKSM